MIDRIRQDIQDRLDQLLTEADRLRQALAALGGNERSESAGRATRSSGSSRSRSSGASSGTPSRARSNSGSSSRTRSRSTSTDGGRAAAGGTKNAVLRALADANGQAMTATEVASATGLGRASVSTTLSKLARAGDVTKASRGYQLSNGSGAAETVAAGAGA